MNKSRLAICVFIVLSERLLIAQSSLKTTVYFDFNKSELKDAAKKSIDSLLDFVDSVKDYHIEIFGHTDSSGSLRYNQKLSEERSRSVFTYLVERNISQEKIIEKNFGEVQPIVSNQTEKGRSENRRVYIRLTFDEHEKSKPGTDVTKLEIGQAGEVTFTTTKGIQVHIPRGFFNPNEINDVRFVIDELDSDCQQWFHHITNFTFQGACLESGAIISLHATIGGITIQPNGSEMMQIKIPAAEMDSSMKVYVGKIGNDGFMYWKLEKGIKLSYEGDYYIFYTADLSCFSIAKPIPDCSINKSGYLIKTKRIREPVITEKVPGHKGEFKGKLIAPKITRVISISLPDSTCIFAQSNCFVALGKKHFYLIRLSDLRFNVRKKYYIIPRRFFHHITDCAIGPPTLCEMFLSGWSYYFGY